MTLVWLITKTILYVFVLNVVFRQSFNFIFVLARRPKTWILLVGLLGFFNIALAYAMEWRDVSSAVFFAFLLNMRPSPPNGITRREMREMAKDYYNELGIPHGRLQASLGLAAFGLLSLGGYVLFFVEDCGSGVIGGNCTPLIQTLI